MIEHEIKHHEYIYMLKLDKALALKFSLQLLKIKMNVFIKLHLYSHLIISLKMLALKYLVNPLSPLDDANYKNPPPDQTFTFRTTSALSLRQFLT